MPFTFKGLESLKGRVACWLKDGARGGAAGRVFGEALEGRVMLSAQGDGWTYLASSGMYAVEDMVIDGQGNIYIAGTTTNQGWINSGIDDSIGGESDAFVVKLNAARELVWARHLGGDGAETGNGIDVDADGDVYVTGATESAGWMVNGWDTTLSGKDGFAVKLSANGEMVWGSYIGGTGVEWGAGIAVDKDGSVYVTGATTSSGWAMGGWDTSYDGNQDAFALKLSSTGGHVWSSYFAGYLEDSGEAIAVNGLGYVFVAGKSTVEQYDEGGFLYRISTDGKSRSGRFYEGYLYDVAADGAGNGFAVGTAKKDNYPFTSGETTLDGEDAIVVRLGHENGKDDWHRYYGGVGNENGAGIAVDAAGNVYITGTTSSAGWAQRGPDLTVDGVDPFVVKITAQGGELGSTYVGTGGDESGVALAVDGAGNVFVLGELTEEGGNVVGFVTTTRIDAAPNQRPNFDLIIYPDPFPEAIEDVDRSKTVTGWALFDSGWEQEAGQTFTFLFTELTNPGLFEVLPAISGDGTLTYTFAANANGASRMTVKVQDSGGTQNGGVDTSFERSFFLGAWSVNDAPGFIATDPAGVGEDAGAQTVLNWAVFEPGAANETVQKVSGYSVEGISNPALFAVLPSVGVDGTLTYMPAKGAFGTSAFKVQVMDNGGAARGGVNLSEWQTFTITVNSVNDAPSFEAADVTVNEDAGAQTVDGWAKFLAGAENESEQTVVGYEVTGMSNPGLFSVMPSVGVDGTLRFTAGANAYGTSTFKVRVQDSGGTENGGADLSEWQGGKQDPGGDCRGFFCRVGDGCGGRSDHRGDDERQRMAG